MCLLVQEAAAQKGGAKAGMRRGGRGGGRTGGRGGGGTRGEEAGAGEWGGRQQGGLDRDRKRPCVGICYLRWGEGDLTRVTISVFTFRKIRGQKPLKMPERKAAPCIGLCYLNKIKAKALKS